MLRGVSFEIPKICTNILWKILGEISPESFCWYVDQNQTEVWTADWESDFFKKYLYSGDEFCKQIRLDHNVIFLKIQAYQKEHGCQHIKCFEEFRNSDCEILLLIYDCAYVEVYSKRDNYTIQLYNTACRKRFQHVAYITDLNDSRNSFNIL